MHRKYWYWLNNIEGIGNAKIRRLLECFENPKEVFFADRNELGHVLSIKEADIENILSDRIRRQAFENYEKLVNSPVKCVFPDEEEYPKTLLELYDKPFVLYYCGSLPDCNGRNVAVVGSRKCSHYGRMVAEELGRVLAMAGYNVISGLALGVDVMAHKGAVMAGGRTYAVLAGGPDRCYPNLNYNTYMEIQKSGGIISEYGPGTFTCAGMFPLRNRIISGLCEAVIVVEAGEKSGSLITADYALEQNRRVFAVPGRIGDKGSMGTNRLLWQGAEIITSYDELLQSLGGMERKENKGQEFNLPKEENIVYEILSDYNPRSLDTILYETQMEMSDIFTILTKLEIKGLICETGKNFYVRMR